MSSNVPVQDYRKIVVFGATGTMGKAVVAGLSPKYEILKVGNRQGQFKADLADAHSIRNVFIYHIDDISRDEPFTVTVKGKPFAVVPYTIRNNDIVRFDSPATTNEAYLHDLKDDFDVLYAEAVAHRRMMSISTHDRISGIPGRVKLMEEFIKYAQKQKGVVFMRKDEIAKWALSASDIPRES